MTTVVARSDGGNYSVVLATSRSEVIQTIDELDKRFNFLKNRIRECLEEHKILVQKVADTLTSLSPDADDHHKVFLQSHVDDLSRAVDHSQVFLRMNFHWNYLDPNLLDHLVTKLDLGEVKSLMERYKLRLQHFRKKTPLSLFCMTQKRKRIVLPADFEEVVVEFKWPKDVTLETVETFRQEYASHYNLHKCAMMINTILRGSFIVTWLIPESIVDKLRKSVPKHILEKYLVMKLIIAGLIVYKKEVKHNRFNCVDV